MPATGRSVDVQLIDIMRCDEDGLVAAHGSPTRSGTGPRG
ncbi:MAG: hypothetical protein WB557_15195 [Solirubrobacteraceae bacterium]